MSPASPREPSRGGPARRLRERAVGAAAAALVAAAAIPALSSWLALGPEVPVAERTAAPGRAGEDLLPAAVDLRGRFRAFDAAAPPLPGRWPRFRGELFDNVGREPVALADRWPAGGPPVLWSVALGEGHAGAAVRDGRVYVLDYDEAEQSDALRCFSLADGAELWRRWYRTGAKRNHGVSRTVPAVDDRFVVSLGPRGHVLCVDAETGRFRWGIDLVRQWGAAEPLWYTAQCPLIDGGRAILAPGGRALMIAVDCASGRVLWEAPNPRGWAMSHASIVPMTFGGRRMYVYAALGGIAGVAADGPDAGTVLWETPAWNHAVVAPSPVPLPRGRVLATAGYGVGSALFQLEPRGGGFSCRQVRAFDRTAFACEQQTPVPYRGRIYTVMPKDGGALRQQVVCLEADGSTAWTSGPQERFGLGPFLIADGKLFVLNDDGVLTMARADAWEVLGRARLLDGPDAWAPMALAGGRLLLRDSRRMVCVDLRPRPAS